ncbi:MAG: Txe/YoeB family addiction module toxin [Kiritimatiellae bacterium]|nr:Txe/YoeB family addiction module toxin [Kiritimatiellia bacterium]
MWLIKLASEAVKDARKIKHSPLAGKVRELLSVLAENPFQSPPPYEKLAPPTAETYSRRINRQHRLVYKVYKDEGVVKILRMWTHYE